MVWNTFKAFIKDENGQTSTEYILLLAVVAMIIFKFKGILDEKITNLINNVFDNQAIRDLTGGN